MQKGLSLGIRKDDPAHPAVQIQEEGINFFIESDDEWFFDGHNLSVTFNDGDDFPQFNYENKNVASATLFIFLNFLIFRIPLWIELLNDTGLNPSFFAQIFVVLAVIQSSPSPLYISYPYTTRSGLTVSTHVLQLLFPVTHCFTIRNLQI